MSAPGPGRNKGTAGQVDAGRHGEVSVEMAAQDILSLAVNVAQNQWPLDERHSTAMRVMLDEVLEQVIEANRQAVSKTLDEKGSTGGRVRRSLIISPRGARTTMDIYSLKPGDKVGTTDGAVVEILNESEDGKWILVRYLEDPENPSVVGTEDLCHADELREPVDTPPAP